MSLAYPLLFISYTTDIPTFFLSSQPLVNLFADDLQAYVNGPPFSQLLLARKIVISTELSIWMSTTHSELH